MKPNNPIMINAATNSSASSGIRNSAAIDARLIFQGSIQGVFSDAAAAGTLILQGSNDPFEELPGGESPLNWVAIANATATVASGAACNVAYIPYSSGSFRWIRAQWTRSGGAGTLTVNGFFQAS